MLALISYPALLEPNFTLANQAWLWMAGYGVLLGLTLACALVVWRSPATATKPDGLAPREPITAPRRLRWVMLALVPSSLMLGVSTHLSTDIGSFPLLWVIPLALYLLSFVVVFARHPIVRHQWVARMAPGGVVILTILLLAKSMQPPVAWWIGIHLAVFFVLSLFCHGELAKDRPDPAHLTEFYLIMAVGGVVGGAFNALIAPLVFQQIWEYPLALVLVCLLRSEPAVEHSQRARQLDWLLPLALGGLVIVLSMAMRSAELTSNQLTVDVLFGVPSVLCYTFVERPLRFALGIAVVQLSSALVPADPHNRPLYVERSFFGVLSVTSDRENNLYQLEHGNTVHGRQHIHSADRAEPLSYYHRTGPVGNVFAALKPRLASGRIAVVGLGIGSLAWYAQPDAEWTFYEIDPTVNRLAHTKDYFRFLEECHAKRLEVRLGDGRLGLQEAPDDYFDLIVLDAFSSDAVPVHLLTREALQLYLAKLNQSGVVVFHISNRFLELKAVLAELADDAQLHCRYRDELIIDPADVGKDPSQWAVMARDPADLGSLLEDASWPKLDRRASSEVWRDDFSNILGVIKWRESAMR
jgi:hypothetical protein